MEAYLYKKNTTNHPSPSQFESLEVTTEQLSFKMHDQFS
jgi:hypothetical protein